MRLSILVPVFNEQYTVEAVLKSLSNLVIHNWELEVIVVNDGSTDNTGEILKKFKKESKKNISVISHSKNKGKGSAIITGIKKAKGDFIVIQDADLEYNPQYIKTLLNPILSGKAKVVYGTRLNRLPNIRDEERNLRFLMHYFGNRMLSLLMSALYKQWVTDMETCYKVFPRDAIKDMNLRSKGFEFEPEITAKLLKKGYVIHEVPIKTHPRGYSEGKKLHTLRDGVKAVITIVKYRIVN